MFVFGGSSLLARCLSESSNPKPLFDRCPSGGGVFSEFAYVQELSVVNRMVAWINFSGTGYKANSSLRTVLVEDLNHRSFDVLVNMLETFHRDLMLLRVSYRLVNSPTPIHLPALLRRSFMSTPSLKRLHLHNMRGPLTAT